MSMQNVTRLEDMSPTGELTLHLQDDGDVVVSIRQTHSSSALSELREPRTATVEFCTSGGRSPKTIHALRNLFEAMILDTQSRSDSGRAW